MSRGTLTVGRLTLKEDYTLVDAVNASSGDRSITLAGVETYPPRPLAELVALGEDLGTLLNQVLPITFSQKAERNGYYEVQDCNVTQLLWQGEAAAISWSLTLNFLGPENAVDVESYLANVVRANDFVLAGERSHAPAIGHYSYQVGNAIPGTVVRTGESGDIAVYRAIPAATNPRWGSPATSYLTGAVRITNNSVVRAGAGIILANTGWEISNGLVKVRAETTAPTATLRVSVWSGGAWRDKAYDVRMSGTTIDDSHFKAVTVTRNDPEVCSIRIVAQPANSTTRYLIDVLLRRGSRVAECYAQRAAAGEISCVPDVASDWTDNTAASGYVIETGWDANGTKAIVGSAKACTLHANGGITKLATTTLDFYVGAEVGGSSLAITDGDFETSVAGWAPSGGTFTRVNDQFKVGSWSAKLVVTGTPTQAFARPAAVTVVPGNRYKVGFWARSFDGATVGCAIDWQLTGVYVSTDASNTVLLAGVWVWLEFEATAPVGTNQAVYGPTLGGSPPTGETLWIDGVQFRAATTVGDEATVMRDQYIGAMSEKTHMVQR